MSFVGIAEAVRLVKELKFLYGRQFVDQWSFLSDVELAQQFADRLSDVYLEQFEHGLKRLQAQTYVPNLPQFKELCLELKPTGQNWLSVNEAWALCLNHTYDRSTKVSVQAMTAFKKVQHIFEVEGQKAAFHAFKGFYSRVVENDKAMGKPQGEYVAPKTLKAPRDTRVSDQLSEHDKAVRQQCLDQLYESLTHRPRSDRSIEK